MADYAETVNAPGIAVDASGLVADQTPGRTISTAQIQNARTSDDFRVSADEHAAAGDPFRLIRNRTPLGQELPVTDRTLPPPTVLDTFRFPLSAASAVAGVPLRSPAAAVDPFRVPVVVDEHADEKTRIMGRIHNAALAIENTALARAVVGMFHALMHEPVEQQDSRDELHDSIDPTTGALTATALARRAEMTSVDRAGAALKAADDHAAQMRTALEDAKASHSEEDKTPAGRAAMSEEDIDRALSSSEHPLRAEDDPRAENMFAK